MIDLERYKPQSWDDIVGNDDLKEFFFDMIYCVRIEGHRSGFNMLGSGPSRGGKTSIIRYGVKCLLCCNFDMETMNPCHQCTNCRSNFNMYGTDGWESWIDLCDEERNPSPVRFRYIPLDCTSLTPKDINECIAQVRVNDGMLKIVYLDEVHRLVRRGLDEQFLKPIEDCDVIWFASSAVIKKEDDEDSTKLEKMFQNRFTFRLHTQKPTMPDMIQWMAERCLECDIKVEDPDATLTLLAERSERLPGMALQVLNKAHKKRSKLLTRKLVESHVFDFDD